MNSKASKYYLSDVEIGMIIIQLKQLYHLYDTSGETLEVIDSKLEGQTKVILGIFGGKPFEARIYKNGYIIV